MSLNKVIESYNSTPGTELELRTKLDSPAAAQRIIAAFSDTTTTIEQSIDFILPAGRGNKIYKLSFVNGTRTGETYTAKEPLHAHHYAAAAAFKLSVAAESISPKFDIAMCKLARIKLRYSVRPIPGWRIDITLVRAVHDIKNELKAAKAAMLFPIDIDKFVAQAPWGEGSSIELEAEHVDTKKGITAARIDAVMEAIMAALQPEHRDAAKAQSVVYRAAQFIYAGTGRAEQFRTAGMLRLYNRVIELNRATYYTEVFPNMADYLLLDKADGKRTFGMTGAGGVLRLVNHTYREYPLAAPPPPGATIFDAECVDDKYYIFDVIAFAGENLTARPTAERIRHIAAICAMAPDILIAKRIVPLGENYAKQIAAMWAAAATGPYEIDGLIFTPAAAPYRTMKSYKWKPISHMSFDFVVRRPPTRLIGTAPYIERPGYDLYLLFCGIRRDMYDRLRLRTIDGYAEIFPGMPLNRYFPIQFAPSNSPYAYLYYHPTGAAAIDNTVCEFRQIAAGGATDGGAGGLHPTAALRTVPWHLIRVRTDRQADFERGGYYGNDYYVAEFTWQNYQSPLLFDDLIISSAEFVDMGYFSETKRAEYKFMTGFNSYAKAMLMAPYAGRDWLVDLAAGTGQDMFRVSELKIRNALFVDRDARGLGEIVSKRAAHQRGFKQQLHTAMYTKLADLSAPVVAVLDDLRAIGIPVGEIDVVMCNFAIHYLTGAADSIRNLGAIVRGLLRPGGEFFFTTFDGAKIHEALRGGAWERHIGTAIQYRIERKYGAAAEFAAAGQAIDVLLPFSAGRMRTEYLVNYDFIAAEFAELGLVEKSRRGFAEFLPGFEAANPRMFAGLSAADKEFAAFYGAMTFAAAGPAGRGALEAQRPGRPL